MSGRLIAVVGPSGVGKDSVIAGLRTARPALDLVQRVITRPAASGGEDHIATDMPGFDAMVADGAFCLWWKAHGLGYGLPRDTLDRVQGGADVIANLSRSALLEADAVFPELLVLNITASPATLARRLEGRGRETETEIAARLAQATKPLPQGINCFEIRNDGALDEAVAAALQVLYPARVNR